MFVSVKYVLVFSADAAFFVLTVYLSNFGELVPDFPQGRID